jgi:hypothetical protein
MIYLPYFVLNSIRFGDGKILLKKYQPNNTLSAKKIIYRDLEYLIINYTPLNPINAAYKQNLIYNYTNSQPLKNTSKLYRKILYFYLKNIEEFENNIFDISSIE